MKLWQIIKTHQINNGEFVFGNSNDSKEYTCKTCGLKIIQWCSSEKDWLTCDEMIIKNIIE